MPQHEGLHRSTGLPPRVWKFGGGSFLNAPLLPTFLNPGGAHGLDGIALWAGFGSRALG